MVPIDSSPRTLMRRISVTPLMCWALRFTEIGLEENWAYVKGQTYIEKFFGGTTSKIVLVHLLQLLRVICLVHLIN
jgi:hypothetical protein